MTTRRGFLFAALGGILAAVGLRPKSGTRVPSGSVLAKREVDYVAAPMGIGPYGTPRPGDVLVWHARKGHLKWMPRREADAVIDENLDCERINRLLDEHYPISNG